MHNLWYPEPIPHYVPFDYLEQHLPSRFFANQEPVAFDHPGGLSIPKHHYSYIKFLQRHEVALPAFSRVIAETELWEPENEQERTLQAWQRKAVLRELQGEATFGRRAYSYPTVSTFAPQNRGNPYSTPDSNQAGNRNNQTRFTTHHQHRFLIRKSDFITNRSLILGGEFDGGDILIPLDTQFNTTSQELYKQGDSYQEPLWGSKSPHLYCWYREFHQQHSKAQQVGSNIRTPAAARFVFSEVEEQRSVERKVPAPRV